MRQITEIIVHCAATRPEWMAGRTAQEKVNEIRRWHVQQNNWADIGYHFIIDRNGEVVTGRPLERAGAHVANRNATTIGICLIGGHGSSSTDQFSDHYTPEQDAALRKLLDDLRERFPVPVSGHNQYANKACPGFNVQRWYEAKPERKIIESKTIIGGAVAGVATVTPEAVDLVVEITQAVSDAQQTLEPLANSMPTLRIICTLLALAGVGLVLYARITDWKRGRR